MGFYPFQPSGGSGGAVSSVFTRTGAVTAQSGDYAVGQVTGAAPLASPVFTGTPAGPTAAAGTSTTQLASTAFVQAALAGTVLMVRPSGDVTGVTDAAAVNAALAALPLGTDGSRHGTVLLAAGIWYMECGQVVASSSAVYLMGMGRWATYVKAVGSGAVFRLFDASDFDTRTIFGGGVGGMTIDTSAITGAGSGVHWGDLVQSQWDVSIVNFTDGNEVINWWADNQWGIGEQATGLVYCAGGSVNYQWDQNPAAGSTMCSGSFERGDLDVFVNQLGAANNGFVWNNGTYITNSFMNFAGNFGGTDAGALTSAVFRAQGATPAGSGDGPAGSIVSNAQWFGNVGVECEGGSAFNPTTFSVDGAGAFFGPIFGNLSFGAAGSNFTPTTAIVAFFGLTDGDPGIVAQSSQPWLFQGITATGTYAGADAIATGGTIDTTASSYVELLPAAAVTGIIMTPGQFDGQHMDVVNASTHLITFAAAGTSNVANGVSAIIPVLQGAAYRWSVNSNLWYQLRNSTA